MCKLYKITANPNTHSNAKFLIEFIKEGAHIDSLVLYALDRDLIDLARALRKTNSVYNNKIVHICDDYYLQGTTQEDF